MNAKSLTSYVSVNTIICNKCDGQGYTTHEEITDYHKGLVRTTKNACNKCDETGRMIQKVLTEEIPYTDDDAIVTAFLYSRSNGYRGMVEE